MTSINHHLLLVAMNKDWKGNSNSAQYAYAIKKKDSTEIREKDDFYATDPKALEMLLDKSSLFLRRILDSCKPDYGYSFAEPKPLRTYWNGEMIHSTTAIWECACGSGNLFNVLKERGYEAIYSDIKDRGFGKFKGMLNVDFLNNYDYVLPWKYNVSVILTNPPYRLANEFIIHALQILPENGLYIALMNLQVLAGIERYEKIYQFGSLREIYVFRKRIRCFKNNIVNDKSPLINYAWFVFQKGYCGNPTVYWL